MYVNVAEGVGGEGASNQSFLAQRGWWQLELDPCGWWCCVRHSTHGTHGQTCTVGACSQLGCKATTYWLTTTGIKLGLWVGSAVWLMRWLGIDSRSVMEEQLHHEAAVSFEGEASLNLCFAIFCIILYQSSTGSIVPCWLSWLDSQHTVRHEGG